MSKLLSYLKPIYKEEAERIFFALKAHLQTIKKVKIKEKNPYWYKFSRIYFIYPDGVTYNKTVSPLRNLIAHLEHIKKLGCNALHILPFLESPMIDKGFDISNFYCVRPELGTMKDLLGIKKAADKLNIRIFMDFVLNHVSDQHEWFEKAQQGDKKYRKYFLVAKRKPLFTRKFHAESAVWAEYKWHGKKIAVNLAFPEHAGEVPHWRQGDDGYWYYHTYYPQQIDLNWLNPNVFIEIAKVMLYWAAHGFNFRFDAIPFVGKTAYKMLGSYQARTHLIIAALKHLVTKVNPECVFSVETYEDLTTVISYFGAPQRVEANLSYNFHLCTHLWVGLIKENINFIWDKLNKQRQIPSYANWINFLRNHDELSLAHLSRGLVKEVRNNLLRLGKDFREGYGIAGRTFSLLNRNKEKFFMAYFLLASLPGALLIPYGDEIACKNIPLSKLTKKQRVDSRNINRGTFYAHEFRNNKAKRFLRCLTSILAKRERFKDVLALWPERIDMPQSIYAAAHKSSSFELIALVNLSARKKRLVMDLVGFQSVAHINSVRKDKGGISLGRYAGIWLYRQLSAK